MEQRDAAPGSQVSDRCLIMRESQNRLGRRVGRWAISNRRTSLSLILTSFELGAAPERLRLRSPREKGNSRTTIVLRGLLLSADAVVFRVATGGILETVCRA